jgi:phage major head subunit gpT-like protein
MIINQASLGEVYTQYNMAFRQGFHMAETYWQQVATRVPSSGAENKYTWLGQFPGLREWLGDRHVKSMKAHGYTIVNKDYEGTVDIHRNEFEDNQYGTYTPMFQEMGYAAKTHPDQLLFTLVEAATSTVCYDGQYMLDTDHPVGSSTVSNYGGGAGNLWVLADLSRPLKPFIYQERKPYKMIVLNDDRDENVFWRKTYVYGVDGRSNVGFGFWQQVYGSKDTLNATNYNAAMAAMMAFTNDEGRKLGVRPTHLLHGPSNRAAALEVLTAERLSNGESNINKGTTIPLLIPWMT